MSQADTTSAPTRRPAITATAHGDMSSPECVTLTVDGVIHFVDVTVDRDDWQLPDVADGYEAALIGAVDDAVEAYLVREQGPGCLTGYFARVA